MTLTERANKLIEDKACILLDRKAWGKDYRAIILVPPPHEDKALRDTEPVRDGIENHTFYQDVITMVEGVITEAENRKLDSNTPVVLRTEKGITGISELHTLPSSLAHARKVFAVK